MDGWLGGWLFSCGWMRPQCSIPRIGDWDQIDAMARSDGPMIAQQCITGIVQIPSLTTYLAPNR